MKVASGSQAVSIARQWLGTPYGWGGGHGGAVRIGTPVDCSGLVDQVFGITGTTYTQESMGQSVPNINAAMPGDLVFFGPLAPNEAFHVGIYTGGGMMIDAPHSGTNVRYDNVGGFGQIAAIRRLVPPDGGSGGTVDNTANGTGPGNVTYSYAQLEGVWNQANGNQQYAPIAAAIAMAESRGNAAAVNNDSDGSQDRGLWQINTIHGPQQSTFDVMGNARAAVAISNNGTNWSPWTTYKTGAYRQFLKANVAPDYTAPINATNAAVNLTNYTGTPSSQSGDICNNIEWAIDPGLCSGMSPSVDLTSFQGQTVGAFDFLDPLKSAEKVAAHIITGMIGAIFNPLIQIVAGILGITGGVIMVGGGFFMMIKQTETYQDTSKTAKSAAGSLAFLAGPEAGAAGEMAAGTSSRQTLRMGSYTRSRTQRGPSQPRPMSSADQINAEAARYRAYSQAMSEWRKAGGTLR